MYEEGVGELLGSQHNILVTRAGEPELGSRELGFFEGAGALFSDVSGAGAGARAIKIFVSSSSYPIIEKM